MQSGRRKALKSFVLHIRFRIRLRPQPACSASSASPEAAKEATKESAKPEPVLTTENAIELCRQLFEEPEEYIGTPPGAGDGRLDRSETVRKRPVSGPARSL
jgi:hypothetical protein